MSKSESIQILERLSLVPSSEARDILAQEKEFSHLVETGQLDLLGENPLFQAMDPIAKVDTINQCIDNRLKQFDRIAQVADRTHSREQWLKINQAAVELNRKRERFIKEYLSQELDVELNITLLSDPEEEKAA